MNTRERARELVLRFGWNATSYQILNPGIRHWFAASAPAVVGYVVRAGIWVVAGAPICAPESLGVVVDELESHAARRGHRVCYAAASERLMEHCRRSPRHARIALGAQPVWNPQHWRGTLRTRASLRAQIARARNKGLRIAPLPATQARQDAALRHCLRGWLAARPLPPLHFLVEPATFDGELADRLLLVARQEDAPAGFLLASPIPSRGGYLIEQIIRAPGAPNGTAELLIDGLMTQLAAQGARYLTMGLVPLSRHADAHLKANPLWLRLLMTWGRAHGRRFYHFDGLEQFRAKLAPQAWEPIHAICNRPRFTPDFLHALLAAFAEGPLALLVARSLARAVATETSRLGSWIRPRLEFPCFPLRAAS